MSFSLKALLSGAQKPAAPNVHFLQSVVGPSKTLNFIGAGHYACVPTYHQVATSLDKQRDDSWALNRSERHEKDGPVHVTEISRHADLSDGVAALDTYASAHITKKGLGYWFSAVTTGAYSIDTHEDCRNALSHVKRALLEERAPQPSLTPDITPDVHNIIS